MSLLSLDVLRSNTLKKDKRNKRALISKQLEYRLEKELERKLDDCLLNNDRVLIEVNKKVLGEFLNILDGRVSSIYDYEQVDNNKFIFSNKEITII